MSTNVKVEIPKDSPKKTIELCDAIILKHTNDGASSSLTALLDMALFGTRLANIKQLRKDAAENAGKAEGRYHFMQFLCGLSKGQNKQTQNTVYWFVLNCRDVLLVKYRGIEQELETWGFNVVITSTGGRRNLRITIPRKVPKDLIELAEAILARHLFVGAASPLNGAVDIAMFTTVVTDARANYDAWVMRSGLAQSQHDQAGFLLGFNEGQNSLTNNTVYYDLCLIRDHLLQRYMGFEEEMTEHGFNVVRTRKLTGVKKGTKRKQIYVASVNAGITVVEPTITIEPSVNTRLKFKKLSEGFEVLTFYFGATDTAEPVSGQSVEVTNDTGTEATLGAIGFPNTFFLVKVVGGVGAKFSIEVMEA